MRYVNVAKTVSGTKMYSRLQCSLIVLIRAKRMLEQKAVVPVSSSQGRPHNEEGYVLFFPGKVFLVGQEEALIHIS